MNHNKIKTLAQLKTAGYVSKTIGMELRENLIKKLKNGQPTFKGIYGYKETVIPEMERALLSDHNINLLGLRGQAKTRLARLMIELLDEWIPVIKGSELNEDPLHPISRYSKEKLAELGDDTPISWLHRSERFYEKLATPDTTVADLIGDVDPIKASNLKLSYADDRVIHYGMIPRANRCIFVINELPDLQARIQVALFNILQEGDIQIRGFKLRLPLDIRFIFTANPEDYTNRGSIVTPLKDRIGSQILTHYPETIETAKAITKQEIRSSETIEDRIYIPEPALDLLEQISFEARESEYVDSKSGVSARLSISAYENLLSTAERRMLLNGEKTTSIRLSDFAGIIPSITGKVELVYEGEQEGAGEVAWILIGEAVLKRFTTFFPEIKKLKKQQEATPYDEILSWFFENNSFELVDDLLQQEYERKLSDIHPLESLIKKFIPQAKTKDKWFVKEMVLWGLAEYKKLSRQRFADGLRFKDPFSRVIDDL